MEVAVVRTVGGSSVERRDALRRWRPDSEVGPDTGATAQRPRTSNEYAHQHQRTTERRFAVESRERPSQYKSSNERMCHRPREELARVLLSLILVLLTFAADCQSAPIPNPRSPWREDEGAPTIFTSSCDPVTGRCLEWLPIVDSHLGDYIIEPDSDYDRAQLIQTRDVDKVSGAWREATSEDRNLGGFGNQMITSRLAKKDVFMSRGWGAGGMPFSVLYMSPRANHPPPSGSI
ncbi:PREDICTED: uncharacterized protein LOC105359691 [Ceratosolen solmsi marchali]|uniref:Uncharacterized protein LOC105359691 n=1 Tax=Ceratosolen solmsi marchali TaxID=326594 RepID=A0AAJ6YBZ6_9HYME|nr:PREDICTED: uncharacterized protein LOC105359691 [Ceratosolen solmsi marchali]